MTGWTEDEPTEVDAGRKMEDVRRRPEMYVGSVESPEQLVWDSVANAIDLHLARRVSALKVVIDDFIEIEDDGPGLSVAREEMQVKTALERALTTFATGRARADGRAYSVAGTPFSYTDLPYTNALSEKLEVETRIDGRAWRQRYARGVASGALEPLGETDRTGVRVRFWPDPTVYKSVSVDRDRVRARLHELAYLNPALTIELDGERMREGGGIEAWVGRRARALGTLLHTPIAVRRQSGEILVEVALAWTDAEASDIASFASQRPTPGGGTHLDGFLQGLAQAQKKNADELRRGLVAIVHAGMFQPLFDGDDADRRLTSPDARDAIRDVIRDALGSFAIPRPNVAPG